MKEEHGFLITYGSLRPPRALRDDFSYAFSSIPLNLNCWGRSQGLAGKITRHKVL
jgi:hypothetical protein